MVTAKNKMFADLLSQCITLSSLKRASLFLPICWIATVENYLGTKLFDYFWIALKIFTFDIHLNNYFYYYENAMNFPCRMVYHSFRLCIHICHSNVYQIVFLTENHKRLKQNEQLFVQYQQKLFLRYVRYIQNRSNCISYRI